MRDGENRVTNRTYHNPQIAKYNLTGEQRDRCFPPQTEWPPLKNPVYRKVYVVGSLANALIPAIAGKIRRALDWEVFDDWHAAHPKADDEWRSYEMARGRTYEEALRAPAGQNVYQFDLGHLNTSTHGLLVLPAGRSGHLELGFLRGAGKQTAILLDADYDRWDVMYAFADLVTRDLNDIIERWRES